MSVLIELLQFRTIVYLFWLIFCPITFYGVLALFNFLKHVKKRMNYNRLLPGLKVSPFNLLGNLDQIPLREASRNGYSIQVFALQVVEGSCQLFRNHDLFCIWASYHPGVFVLKPAAIEMVMKDAALLNKSWVYNFLIPYFGEGLITSPSYIWKPRRKLLNPCLHLDILREFIPIFNEQALKLVSNLQNGNEDEIKDIFDAISNCSLDITCETLLGVKIGAQDNKHNEYVHAIHSMGLCVMERVVKWWTWPDFVFRFTETGKILKQSVKIAHNLTNTVLQQKKKEYLNQVRDASARKRKTVLDLLLEHHLERQSISEEEIREEIDTFTAAANETTSIAIYLVLYFLGQHKDMQAKVRQELDAIFGQDKEKPVENEDLKDMEYMECVIKETLRLQPSVPMFGRTTVEEKIICGYKIPKGATIVVCPYILHRNPDVFPDPEKFDPTRFLPENSAKRHPFAYIPFSAGPRNCIGQKFAMMEMKIIVSTVLRHFSVESFPHRDKLVPSPAISLKMSGDLGFLFKRL